MIVQDKVKEAEFFLSKMKCTEYSSDEKMYYLFAFLASARGILEDTILYDYALKYELAVSLRDQLSIAQFRRLAACNSQATRFVDWFDGKMTELSKNEYWSKLGRERNIVVHRGKPSLQHNVGNYIATSLTASVVVRDPDGNIVDATPPASTPQSPPPTRDPEYTISFQEFPRETIDESCNKLFCIIRKVVQEALSEFP